MAARNGYAVHTRRHKGYPALDPQAADRHGQADALQRVPADEHRVLVSVPDRLWPGAAHATVGMAPSIPMCRHALATLGEVRPSIFLLRHVGARIPDRWRSGPWIDWIIRQSTDTALRTGLNRRRPGTLKSLLRQPLDDHARDDRRPGFYLVVLLALHAYCDQGPKQP